MTARRQLWTIVAAVALAAGCGRGRDRPLGGNEGGDLRPAASSPGEWPQWRGPHRDGTVASPPLLPRWGWREPPEVWRRGLGAGFSGIAVAEGRAVTLFARDGREILVALDARDGREIWRRDLGRALADAYGDGPRSTPAVDGGSVFALTSLGTLVAAEAADGREIWRFDLDRVPQWGASSSPLVVDGLVVVQGEWNKKAVVAVDRTSGELVWAASAGHPGYASPQLVTVAGRRAVAAFVGTALIGLVPETGEVLWHGYWPTESGVNAADPVFLPPDRFYLSASYGMGAALVRLTPDGDDGFDVTELWRTRAMKNRFSSAVAVDGYAYGFDEGILKCLDLATGEVRWRQRGFDAGSLVAADGKLIVLGGQGRLALVVPTPEEYRELGSLKVFRSRSWTPPSLAGTWLYLRNQEEIVCLDLTAKLDP